MADTTTNARRMIAILDRMRSSHQRSPVFERLSALGLSPSHLRLLRLLAPDRALAMKEIADELAITPPSLTALTRRLVQGGLVERRPHDEDSRVVLLALTAAGRDLHRAIDAEHLARMAHLLAGLSADEQRLFLDLLERATTQE